MLASVLHVMCAALPCAAAADVGLHVDLTAYLFLFIAEILLYERLGSFSW